MFSNDYKFPSLKNIKHKTSNIKNTIFRKIVTGQLTREVAMNGKADTSGSLQRQVVQEHGDTTE